MFLPILVFSVSVEFRLFGCWKSRLRLTPEGELR